MASAMFGAMRKTWKSNNMTTGTAGGSRHFSGRDKQMVDSLGGQFNMLLSSLSPVNFSVGGEPKENTGGGGELAAKNTEVISRILRKRWKR